MNQPARKPTIEFVNIPCEIQPGAFPGEFLVIVKVGEEVISGFVREEFITFNTPGEKQGPGFIRGTIVERTPQQTLVQMPGSFFTTATGLTSVSSQWAERNLVPA